MPTFIFKLALLVKFSLSVKIGGQVKAEGLVKDIGLLGAECIVKVSSWWRYGGLWTGVQEKIEAFAAMVNMYMDNMLKIIVKVDQDLKALKENVDTIEEDFSSFLKKLK